MRSAAAIAAVLALLLAFRSVTRADAKRGERVFQRCYACHSVRGGEDRLPGPTLRGVLGRRAGTLPGFEFSPAMTAAGAGGLVWTRATLDAFLADPYDIVPGTVMGMPPLIDAQDRQDVIDFLEEGGSADPHVFHHAPRVKAPAAAGATLHGCAYSANLCTSHSRTRGCDDASDPST